MDRESFETESKSTTRFGTEAWEADREEFFATFEKAAQHADLSEAEAEEIALKAVAAVRSSAA